MARGGRRWTTRRTSAAAHAGLGSIPGTAAEILDDEVREILPRQEGRRPDLIEIIKTARTGSCGDHVDRHVWPRGDAGHVARHIDLLRTIQRETRGFTEFVPLGFIWENTQLYHDGKVTPQPKGLRDLRVYAVSRLMLRGYIDHLQTSWVKLGHRLAQLTLRAGCDDFGGTSQESICARRRRRRRVHVGRRDIGPGRSDGPAAGPAHDPLRTPGSGE
jgi:2-iminoacetate synthase ThiH